MPMRELIRMAAKRRPGNWNRASAAPSGRPMMAAQATAVRLTRSDSQTISIRPPFRLTMRCKAEAKASRIVCMGRGGFYVQTLRGTTGEVAGSSLALPLLSFPLSRALKRERGTHRVAMGGEGSSRPVLADPYFPIASQWAPPSPASKRGRGEFPDLIAGRHRHLRIERTLLDPYGSLDKPAKRPDESRSDDHRHCRAQSQRKDEEQKSVSGSGSLSQPDHLAEAGRELQHIAPRLFKLIIEQVANPVELLDLLLPGRGISGLDRCFDGRTRAFVFLMPGLEKLDLGVQSTQLPDILRTQLGDFTANELARVGELGPSLSGLFVGRSLEVGQRPVIVRRDKASDYQPAHEKPLFDRAQIASSQIAVGGHVGPVYTRDEGVDLPRAS